MRFDFKKSGQN